MIYKISPTDEGMTFSGVPRCKVWEIHESTSVYPEMDAAVHDMEDCSKKQFC